MRTQTFRSRNFLSERTTVAIASAASGAEQLGNVIHNAARPYPDNGHQAFSNVFTLAMSPASSALVNETDPSDVAQRAGGWVAPIAEGLETVLKTLQNGLDTANVPYSYGFSIIILTMIVKIATYPLTKQQVESALAVQSLKPRIDLIKQRYGDDKDRISSETSVLYEQAGVNPLAGCLPSLATIPVFIGLYSSLTNAASDGLFDTQGFFWIPSLAGPTSVAARQAGSGISWLYPLVDGAPPMGWEAASPYLILPVLLVLTQYLSNAIVNPPINPEDPNANTTRALSAFFPLLIGFFSLNVPSGLTLYYFSNTVLTMLVQIYLKKLGGANVVVNDLGPVTKPGSGRRTGQPVVGFTPWVPTTVALTPVMEPEPDELTMDASSSSENNPSSSSPSALDPVSVSRRVKRKRMDLILSQQRGSSARVLSASATASNGSSSSNHDNSAASVMS
ncbi:hypothetical protein CEUSTIGMA_g5059.t1 [Chlamydomonas eustigma]|uniref:Membrane insertase YidC/Oxa/ALB C-terminal domain-containing protein n=1 Tax=Chlamydomonas eustigma TaxID=1157962 RepID=A0A250X3H2_9CHLO|nr:hypothetical protein CEUSTIGMA_g5059.t1 [Chlamydomonas eustigma]|eukprot:GAX77615.1 hypothetical protein CEUSTIGMA_g5059.t1 [Chlamydomonas eustigma]